ncbi:MAG: aspartate carbamoyltransferase [Candidatus Diapherotrites archaeon]|uniref:Aspartate carbamoyltransferase n=1 Tax=Candidatus Iainarchaeum sp. TaxID=3101447 RepID=A0A8T4C6F5_9ARCH|nr:aspartate carbamoyltransferase [Candidatus Diapherotrites archaeon]
MKISHVLSTRQFADPSILQRLFELSLEMEKNVVNEKLFPVLNGKVMATLFYEPSTRTRFSFESAMNRLGGRVISTEAAGHFSSVTKGETLEDTIRIAGNYADVIVLRHFEKGSAEKAASVSRVPVINAGDGPGEHPTQALLDMYTIWREHGRMDKLNVILMGDLLYGRTVHSLIQLLSIFPQNTLTLVSPPTLKMPESYTQILREKNISYTETDTLPQDLSSVDVLYVTRVQKERFADENEYLRMKNCCNVDETILSRLAPNTIIMHPLPRVGEISPAIDADPRAAYFRQAGNGLFVRMALLELLFQKRSLEQKTLVMGEKGFW